MKENDRLKEQCICIKLFEIGRIGAETFQMLTFAFREEAVGQTVVFDCSAIQKWNDICQGC